MTTEIDSLREILNSSKMLLMFDYDGTLTPIMDKPEYAVLDLHKRDLIEQIASMENIQVAIVTGREIEEFVALSGIKSPHIEIFGVYGAEYLCNGQVHLQATDNTARKLNEFAYSLSILKSLDGIFIQQKSNSVCIHYRQASEATAEFALRKIYNLFAAKLMANEFNLTHGKKVVEILPKKYNKGCVAASLVAKYHKHVPIYFGDDLPDYYAFKEVKKANGYAVMVGRNDEQGVDFTVDIDELYEFLAQLK